MRRRDARHGKSWACRWMRRGRRFRRAIRRSEERTMDGQPGRARALNLWYVLMKGEGPARGGIEKDCIARAVQQRVKILGPRDPIDVYQAADALLLSSRQEGFSLVCAEAMCVGTPIFRTRTAGTEELVIENVTGRSVPIDHEAFIAGAPRFPQRCPTETLRQMGAAGQPTRAEELFVRPANLQAGNARPLPAACYTQGRDESQKTNWRKLHGSRRSRRPPCVLVTGGGAGFQLGSHLVNALVQLGAKVRVIDDLSTGRAENIPSGVELIRKSVTRCLRSPLHGV